MKLRRISSIIACVACLLHGMLTATALRQLPRRIRPTTLGVLATMGIHYAANLPIYPSGIDLAGLGPGVWQAVVHNERCPGCRRWHWTSALGESETASPPDPIPR
jgi:hypothetical protein